MAALPGRSAARTLANHQTSDTVTLAPGTYEFHCEFHDDMTGTLTVS